MASTADTDTDVRAALADLVAAVREEARRFQAVADNAEHTRQNAVASYYRGVSDRLTAAADKAETSSTGDTPC